MIIDQWEIINWIDNNDHQWFPHYNIITVYFYFVAKDVYYCFVTEPIDYYFVAKPIVHYTEAEGSNNYYISKPIEYYFTM